MDKTNAETKTNMGDRVRIILAIIAAALAIWTTGPAAYEQFRDVLGWSRPSIIVSKQIQCDATTGDCTGIPLIKKLRDDCETTRIGFSGFAGVHTFSATRVGKARNVTKTDSAFISFEVPYKMAAPYGDIPDGQYPITAGGVDYQCKGRPQFVEFPRQNVTVDGIEYFAATVTFKNSAPVLPGDE